MRNEREVASVPLPRESRLDSTESQVSMAEQEGAVNSNSIMNLNTRKWQENAVYLSRCIITSLSGHFLASFLFQRSSYCIEYKIMVS